MILNSSEPIYLQLKNYYARLIETGALKEKEAMPSVREVALAFNLNPNTVQRSFSLLVEEGYLTSIPKKGFFVLGKKKDSSKLKKLREALLSLKEEGYSKQEIQHVLEEIQ